MTNYRALATADVMSYVHKKQRLTNRITGAYTPGAYGETRRRPQPDCADERVYKCPVHPLVRRYL